MIPLNWAGAACALMLLLGFSAGVKWESNAVAAAQAHEQRAAAQADHQQRIESSKVETVYVDRVQKIEVPVERTITRLVRAACVLREHAAGGLPMPAGTAGQPADAAAPADADAGLLAGIARDSQACLRNAEQLRDLQALVCANSAQPETCRQHRGDR